MDRLYILAALVALGARDVVPWWAVVALVARDLVLAATLPVLRRRGYGPYEVIYLGKGATFLLLYAFPLLLAASGTGWFADLARPFAYAFAVWGTALYLYTGAALSGAVRAGHAHAGPLDAGGPGIGPRCRGAATAAEARRP